MNMRLLVINLERSLERRKWITDSFAAQTLVPEFVSAIDANAMEPGDIDAWNESSDGPPMMAAEIAVFKSHRKCWDAAASGDDEYVCIFEDDVHLSSDAHLFLKDGSWIPDGADIIKIETFRNSVHCSRPPLQPVHGHQLLRLHTLHWGAAGYIISRSCAARLFELSKTRLYAADEFLFSPTFSIFRDLDLYQVSPALCIQDMQLEEINRAGNLQSVKGVRDDHHLMQQPQAPVRGWKKARREIERPFRKLASSIDRKVKGKFSTVIDFER